MYKLEITNANGNTIQTHIFPDHDVKRELVHVFAVDQPQVNHAIDVIQAGNSVYDLHIADDTSIYWTARLSYITADDAIAWQRGLRNGS